VQVVEKFRQLRDGCFSGPERVEKAAETRDHPSPASSLVGEKFTFDAPSSTGAIAVDPFTQ
jgi:hypothetical protein